MSGGYKLLLGCLFGMAGLGVVLGGATYLLPSVTGQLSARSESGLVVAGYPQGKAGARPFRGANDRWVNLEYSYYVEGETHLGHFVGLYLPTTHGLDFEPGDEFPVYYLPGHPGLALIKRGFDFRVVLGLLAMGISLLVFERFLQRYWLSLD